MGTECITIMYCFHPKIHIIVKSLTEKRNGSSTRLRWAIGCGQGMHYNNVLLCLPSVHRGGDILLYPCPLSLSQSVTLCNLVGESVSHSFLSSAFYGAGGQTRDIDPMLG